MKYIDIQKELVQRFNIVVDPESKCWGRMHAHVKSRKVCKFHFKNSVVATFDLLHEIGHIETSRPKMRRAEDEYSATVWALKMAREYGLTIPDKTIQLYQDYIDMEKERGIRRGGSGYGTLSLRRAMMVYDRV